MSREMNSSGVRSDTGVGELFSGAVRVVGKCEHALNNKSSRSRSFTASRSRCRTLRLSGSPKLLRLKEPLWPVQAIVRRAPTITQLFFRLNLSATIFRLVHRPQWSLRRSDIEPE